METVWVRAVPLVEISTVRGLKLPSFGFESVCAPALLSRQIVERLDVVLLGHALALGEVFEVLLHLAERGSVELLLDGEETRILCSGKSTLR